MTRASTAAEQTHDVLVEVGTVSRALTGAVNDATRAADAHDRDLDGEVRG